jgi:Mg-chelatase subunit ChlD
MMRAQRSFRASALANALLLLPLASVAWWTIAGAKPTDRRLGSEGLAVACGSPNPFLVTSRFVDHLEEKDSKDLPVIFAFRETPDDRAEAQVPLASYAQAGSVFGMAYDPARRRVYASAFTRRGSLFPPGGPGTVLGIDLATGAVQRLASLAAGPSNIHGLTRDRDAAAGPWVGRSALGDLELSPDGSVLFAANLFDGRIHRVAVDTGSALGSLVHGGASEAWGAEARPFGLAWKDDWLYHGVVEAVGATEAVTIPIGHLYRSRADGTAMREVARFLLDSVRGSPAGPWTSADRPAITAIDFLANGDMAIGLRNLRLDAEVDKLPDRRGDLLTGRLRGDTWFVSVDPEPFEDQVDGLEEAGTGALAVLPGMDLIVATGHGARDGSEPDTAFWLDAMSGLQRWTEPLPPAGPAAARKMLGGSGALALLCPPDQELDPGLVATATVEAAQRGTATQIAVATQAAQRGTAVAATNTALAPTRAALATAAAAVTIAPSTATAAARLFATITAACDSDDPYYAMANPPGFPYEQMSGREQAVAVFNRGRDERPLTLTDARRVGHVFGLAYDGQRGHLYAAALGNGVPRLGVAGQGAIYRLDLATGAVVPWIEIDAGPPSRLRRRPGYPPLTGFGDIEIDEASSTLVAVNNFDQRIYRFALPDGEVLGSFANGTGKEVWAPYARPFGLGLHEGWLYHGVFTPHLLPMAIVFRSRPDGSNMSEVLRFMWNYRDPNFRPSAVMEVDRASSFELPGFGTRSADRWPATLLPAGDRAVAPLQAPEAWQPIAPDAVLTDIEFRPNGNLILGMHNNLGGLGGAVLPTERTEDGWEAIVRRRFYLDDWDRRMLPLGSLARVPGADQVVASFSGIPKKYAPSAAWYDNRTGGVVSGRMVFDHAGVKSTTLGDVESLCSQAGPTGTASPTPEAAPSLTPTPSPSPSPSATLRPVATASPTASPTSSATTTTTPTATRLPRPLYLPLTLRERCVPDQRRVDVVLVIDASSSMGEITAAGRPKIAAALEAARIFLDQLDPVRGDQAAIVAFNAAATLLQPLTTDRAALNAALARVQLARETCLVCGVEVGDAELAGPRMVKEHAATMIVLTDGRSNPRPAREAVERAALAKARGVTVFTIGLGDDIDAEALLDMASRPDFSYRAPDAEDLAAIYRAIAVAIPCRSAGFWGGR